MVEVLGVALDLYVLGRRLLQASSWARGVSALRREFNNLVFGLGAVAAWNSAMYDRDLGVYELLLFLVSDWF